MKKEVHRKVFNNKVSENEHTEIGYGSNIDATSEFDAIYFNKIMSSRHLKLNDLLKKHFHDNIFGK